MFSQYFFELTRNQEGKTFDVALAEYFSTTQMGEMSVSFLNEVSSIAKASSILVEGGLLSKDGMSKQNIGLFLTSSLAPELIRTLGGSALITTSMPFIVEVAANIGPIKAYLQTDAGLEIDYTYNYAKTFDDLADLYDAVIESGVVDKVLDENFEVRKVEDILTDEFVSENRGIVSTVVESLDKESLNLLNNVVEAALFVRSAKEAKMEKENPEEWKYKIGVKDFLPEFGSFDEDGNGIPDRIPDSFKEMNWSKEIADVIDPVFDLICLDSRFIGTALSATSGNIDINSVIDIVVDNFDAVEDIVCGAQPSQNLQAERMSDKALLGSMFIQRAMPKFFNILEHQLNEKLSLKAEHKIDFTDLKSNLLKNANEESFAGQISRIQKEFRGLFDVVGEFVHSDAGVAFIKDIKGMPGVYFDPKGSFLGVDDELLTCLSSALAKLDNSLIVKEVLPNVLQDFVEGDKSPLKSMKLGDIRLNFDIDNLGSELSGLIVQFSKSQDLVSYIMSIGTISTSDLSSASKALSGLAQYSGELLDFLLYVASSKIVNPVVEGKTNYNVAEILKSLLGGVFKNISEKVDMVYEPDYDINAELTGIVNLIVDLDKYDVVNKGLSMISGGLSLSNIDLQTFADVDFADIFENLDDTKLISSLAIDLLDSKIFAAGGKLHVDGVEISFNNIESWAIEGNTINAMVRAANEIGDLSKIDIFNSDPVAVQNLFNSLSQSTLFTKDGDYLFSEYAASLLDRYIGKLGSLKQYFTDRDGVHTTTLQNDIKSVTKDEWLDESYNLAQMIRKVSACSSLLNGNIDLKDINGAAIESLLASVSDSKAFGNALTPNVYKFLVDKLSDAGLSAFKDANLDFAYSATSSERKEENRQIVLIMERVLDPVYGLTDFDRNFSNIDINQFDEYYLINPFLKAMAGSRFFNTLSDEQISSGITLTAFEREFADLIKKTKVYDDTRTEKAVLRVTKGMDNFDAIKSAWYEEIDDLTNCLTYAKALDLSINNLSLKSLFPNGRDENRRANLEQLLFYMNESAMFQPVLAENIERAIKSESQNIGNVSINGINLFYSGIDEDGFANPYDAAEINVISYIFQDITCCELSFNDIKGVDTQSAVDFLNHIASSKLFNTYREGYDFTAIENIFSDVLHNASIYDSKEFCLAVSESVANHSTSFETRKALWLEEVSAIEEVINQVKASDIGIDNFDFNSLLNDGDSEEQRIKLKNVLVAISDTKTMHAAVPNKVASALENMTIPFNGINFDDANYYYNGFDTFVWSDPSKPSVNIARAYDETEIDGLTKILASMNNMGSIDSNDLTTIDAEEVTNVLSNLAKSYVFNSLKDNHSKTSFDVIFAELFSYNQIGDLYYSNDNPVDRVASYSNSHDKALAYALSTWAPLSSYRTPDDVDTSEIDAPVKSLRSILNYFTDLSHSSVLTSMAGTGVLDADTVYDALKVLSDCDATKDLAPNAVSKMLRGATMSVNAVNMKRANVYYCYENGLNGRYDDEELLCIHDIIAEMNALQDSLGTSALDTLSSSSINDESVNHLTSLLSSLNDSQIFHLSGARSGSDYSDLSVGYWKEDLTVFEQILATIYDKSGAAEAAYIPAKDPSFSNYHEKLRAKIDGFAAGTLDSMHASLSNRYELEIDNLNGLLLFAVDNGLATGGLNLGTYVLDGFTPAKLETLVRFVNNSDIVCDSVPNKIDGFMKQIGIVKYQSVMVAGEKVDVSEYYISQEEYALGAIDSIGVFADLVYVNGGYLTFDGEGATDMAYWVMEDGKLSGLISVLDNPHGFYAPIKYLGTGSGAKALDTLSRVDDGANMTARDVVLYNILSFKSGSTTIPVGKHLGEDDTLIADLNASMAMFNSFPTGDRSAIYSREENSLKAKVRDVVALTYAFDSASENRDISINVSGHNVDITLPESMAYMEAASSVYASSAIGDSLFDYFASTEDCGAILARLSAGVLGKTLNAGLEYLAAGNYFHDIFDIHGYNLPSSFQTNRTTYASNAFDGISFYDNPSYLANAEIKALYDTEMNISSIMGIQGIRSDLASGTTSFEASEMSRLASLFADLDNLSDASARTLARAYDISYVYDYVLNRAKFYGDTTLDVHGTPVTMLEKDLINPFASTFAFSDVMSYLA
ncbi:MAG: hypothetical protein MJ238_02095 [Bacilli bacterium]|nr:hypothetical protein [Bacilli bacterium]